LCISSKREKEREREREEKKERKRKYTIKILAKYIKIEMFQ